MAKARSATKRKAPTRGEWERYTFLDGERIPEGYWTVREFVKARRSGNPPDPKIEEKILRAFEAMLDIVRPGWNGGSSLISTDSLEVTLGLSRMPQKKDDGLPAFAKCLGLHGMAGRKSHAQGYKVAKAIAEKIRGGSSLDEAIRTVAKDTSVTLKKGGVKTGINIKTAKAYWHSHGLDATSDVEREAMFDEFEEALPQRGELGK